MFTASKNGSHDFIYTQGQQLEISKDLRSGQASGQADIIANQSKRNLGRVDTNHLSDESEVDEGSEHDVEFFKAGEDTTKTFKPAEQAFDFIPAFVNLFVILPRVQAV